LPLAPIFVLIISFLINESRGICFRNFLDVSTKIRNTGDLWHKTVTYSVCTL